MEQSQAQSRLGILATTIAVPGKEEALRSVQEQLVEATVKEAGCIRYELNQSLDNPRLTLFIEEWENEESWNAHMEGDAIRRYRESNQGLIEEAALHRLKVVADGQKA